MVRSIFPPPCSYQLFISRPQVPEHSRRSERRGAVRIFRLTTIHARSSRAVIRQQSPLTEGRTNTCRALSDANTSSEPERSKLHVQAAEHRRRFCCRAAGRRVLLAPAPTIRVKHPLLDACLVRLVG